MFRATHLTALASTFTLAIVVACGGSEPSVADSEPVGSTGGNDGVDGGASSGASGPVVNIAGQPGRAGGDSGTAADGSGGNAGGGSTAVCGDGVVEGDEACDDGNLRPTDGCSGICTVESGYACPSDGGACTRTSECGNDTIEPSEQCDFGDTDPGDGCSATCRVESGYVCDSEGCTRQPSSVCGDGVVGVGEQCEDDDETPTSGDGCSATCQVETGYRCSTIGSPCEEIITEVCGNGRVDAGEDCDDGLRIAGDGCSAQCTEESGYDCSSGTCQPVCGDGLVIGGEACDEGAAADGVGCINDCGNVESGYVCPTAAGVGGACVEQSTEVLCPNGRIDFGEQCDDANATDDDGCTGCVIDDGYRCPSAGALCELLPVCGDGNVDILIGEECDDGEFPADGGDGCSASCEIESGFKCPTPTLNGTTGKYVGGACEPVVCGDGVLEGGEECDDGVLPAANGDGCSTNCEVEAGWTCPLNASCTSTECGDGTVAGFEECDNGADNDGLTEVGGVVCSANCLLVANPADCGNGTLDPGEACDWSVVDGNGEPVTPCTRLCTREPRCAPPAPCQAECGDGIKFGTEACDDGNNRDGDGCSSSCEVEPGFTCTEDPGDDLILPIVYRDFPYWDKSQGADLTVNTTNPDFQWSEGDPISQTDEANDIWVRSQLGQSGEQTPDGQPLLGKPVFRFWAECDTDSCDQITEGTQPANVLDASECNGVPGSDAGIRDLSGDGRPNRYCGYGTQDFRVFSEWYLDSAKSTTVAETLTLSRNGNTFEFDSTGDFLPTGTFSFTSELRYWFEYDASASPTLTFDGDDDVWVFVNGFLVIDISGTHGEITDSFTVDPSLMGLNPANGNRDIDLQLEDGEVYEIAVFHAERNTNDSNYRLTLSDFVISPSVCTSTCGDGEKATDEQCDGGNACTDASTCTDGQCANGDPCSATPTNDDSAYGGCRTDCSLGAYCGDGTPDAGDEACDDGRNSAIYSVDPNNKSCAPGCVFAPFCGDGTPNPGFEECDDGPTGSATCTASCTFVSRCGDGTVDPDEQCDDGVDNGTLTSSCDAECKDKCGNGSVDAGEECDPGTGNFTSAYGGCLQPIDGVQAGCVLGPRCGDGIRNGTGDDAEACDDGKNDGAYGTCAPMCVLGPRCGDGVLQGTAGEICDNGQSNLQTAYQADGQGLCTTVCTPVGYCGDGAVTDGEGCDDGKNDGTPGSCETDCSAWVELTSCGNGVLDAGEDCDDGEANNGTASSENCDASCRFRCGNGIVEEALGEECDDGTNDGRYGTCNSDCSLAGFCGDGAQNGPEACDLGDENDADAYGTGCTNLCQTAPSCGDGRIQVDEGEECDGTAGCGDDCRKIVVQ